MKLTIQVGDPQGLQFEELDVIAGTRDQVISPNKIAKGRDSSKQYCTQEISNKPESAGEGLGASALT